MGPYGLSGALRCARHRTSLCTLSYSNETEVVAGDAGGAKGDVDFCPVTTKKFKSEKGL